MCEWVLPSYDVFKLFSTLLWTPLYRKEWFFCGFTLPVCELDLLLMYTGVLFEKSASAWRTDLWIPALGKIPIRVSFLVPHQGLSTADSFIRCPFITYCFCPYDAFVWCFGTLCGLVGFFSAWKMLSLRYLCPLQTECVDWVRYLFY